MSSRSIRSTLAAVALLAASATSSAYPIAPRTLWDLVAESERVVVARVAGVAHRSGGDDAFESSTARLQVLEAWKGRPDPGLEVTFSGGLICPAPDRYIEGETVLAFLESGEARLKGVENEEDRAGLAERWSGRWFTVALSYGTLYPEPDELPVFRQLVAEALALQARGEVRDEEKRAWLVKAAAHPATRWHGLYGLERSADPMHSFYDRRPAPPALAGTLTPAERLSLAEGFRTAPALDETVPMMLKLLANHASREVDLVALAAVETALAEDRVPYWVHEAIPLVLARFGEPAQPRPSKKKKGKKKDCDFGDDPLLRSMSQTDDQTRQAWAQARERLGLPAVAPLPRPVRRIRDVGADTPP